MWILTCEIVSLPMQQSVVGKLIIYAYLSPTPPPRRRNWKFKGEGVWEGGGEEKCVTVLHCSMFPYTFDCGLLFMLACVGV